MITIDASLARRIHVELDLDVRMSLTQMGLSLHVAQVQAERQSELDIGSLFPNTQTGRLRCRQIFRQW